MSNPLPTSSRREFLRCAATAAGAATLLPCLSNGADATPAAQATATPSAKTRNAFAYRFAIGEIEAWSISDGHMLFREGLNLMWPDRDRDAMREDLIAHGERIDALPLYVNILVLKLGSEIAIFDAGFGRGRNPEIGWVADALASIPIAPEKVTHAFLSHAHADHLNGFVSGNKPLFPNAALHCLRAEVDFWRAPEPDFSKSRRAKGPLPNMIKQVRGNFDILEPNLQLHPGRLSLLNDAITLEPAPGHTAGHAVFRIRSGQESLLHFMDVAHHHTLMFTNPAWGIAFDHEPDLAIETRKKLFAQLAATRERAYGFHLPWPGIGRITPRGTGYAWEGERWSWGS